MTARRTILIADPDTTTVRELKEALKGECEVLAVRDGSKALEVSIVKYPDLILFYRKCPLIGATQFARILRTNPRTENIPLIVLSDEPLAATSAVGFLEGVLVKPLNLDEVRARVAAVLRRVDTAKQVGGERGAVSGTLDQISMADLLQVFSLNRRSGSLQLARGSGPDEQQAEVFLAEGRIVDATAGHARGEKALYRLLTWGDGRFSFVPGKAAPSVSLSASTDSLLLVGLRQADELGRLAAELPGLTATIERLEPPEGLPMGLHPVTAQTLALAEHYPRLSDLLDRAEAPDLEVLLALRSLVQAGLVRFAAQAPSGAEPALLSPDQVLDLRSRLRRSGLAPTYLGCPKVAVVAAQAADVWQLGVALSRLPRFRAADLAQLAQVPLGAVGSLPLDAGLTFEFFAVSPDERLLPLAYGMSAGTVAALVVGTDRLSEITKALDLLEIERRAALLLVRRPNEPTVAVGGRQLVVDVEDLSDESVRRVLATLFQQVAGQDVRGASL